MADVKQLRIIKQGTKVWKEWLTRNRNIKIDFRGASLIALILRDANLGGADLRGTNLRSADLRGTNLLSADLSSADLRGANLSSTDLRGANLRGSDLSGSDFSGSDLSGANLSSANLHEAEFSESDFNSVNLAKTIFSNVDLSMARNLSICDHLGASFIDRNTLIQSGYLPKEFLQGCGLPDWEIEATKLYNPNLTDDEIIQIQQRIYELRTNQLIQFYSCFISYSHADKAFAQQLHDRLQQEGIRVWLDEHQLLPGDDIYDRIERGILLWDKVLLCCSQKSLCSWWVDNEIDLAFEKERQLMKEREQKVLALIPLNLDGYMFTDGWKSGKKRQVLSRVAADFVGWDKDGFDFGSQIEKVIKALRLGENTRGQAPDPKL